VEFGGEYVPAETAPSFNLGRVLWLYRTVRMGLGIPRRVMTLVGQVSRDSSSSAEPRDKMS
jgi:hypothetical protein